MTYLFLFMFSLLAAVITTAYGIRAATSMPVGIPLFMYLLAVINLFFAAYHLDLYINSFL